MRVRLGCAWEHVGDPAEVPWLESQSIGVWASRFSLCPSLTRRPRLCKVGPAREQRQGAPCPSRPGTDTCLQWPSQQAQPGPHVQARPGPLSFLSSQGTQVPRKVWLGQGTGRDGPGASLAETRKGD